MFEPLAVNKKLTKEDCSDRGITPVYSAETANSGIIGYTEYAPEYKITEDSPVYVIFGDHTRTFNLATESFCVADNVKVIKPTQDISIPALLFITTSWKRCIPSKGYMRHWNVAKEIKFELPVENGEINFPFMEKFITELEAQRITELKTYLSAAGLSDYILTKAEQDALQQYNTVFWNSFNLEKLFGKSTRGKRLKSADRIPGSLPFVTAGEAEEGVSAYIGNDVEIFSGNTTTIDMFGSAKYRCYDYGGDDHIAVVHTEGLPKCAAIFVTTAAHKAAHTGKFDYGHNFYAKDADALDIMLPSKDGQPDYGYMELLVSAIQKMVIKDVILYANKDRK